MRIAAMALVGRIGSLLAFLAYSGLLTRGLGFEQMSIFVLLLALVMVSGGLARGGLHQIVVRLVARQNESGEDVGVAVSKCLLLAGGLGAVGGLLALVAVTALTDSVLDGRVISAVFVGWVSSEALRVVLTESVRATGRPLAATLLGDFGRNVLLLSGALGLGDRLDTAVVAACLMAGCNVVILLLGARLLVVNRLVAKGLTTEPSLAHVMRLAAPLMLSTLGLITISQLDLLLVGALYDSPGPALYGIATRLAMVSSVPLYVANAASVAVIARLAAQGAVGDVRTVAQGIGGLALGSSLLVTSVLLVFGREVLSVMFGAEYRAAYPVLVVLLLGQLVVVGTGLAGVILIMFDHQVVVSCVTGLIGAAMAIGCSLAALLDSSLETFAAVFVFCVAIQNLTLWYICRRRVTDVKPSIRPTVWRHALSLLTSETVRLGVRR